MLIFITLLLGFLSSSLASKTAHLNIEINELSVSSHFTPGP